MINSTSLDPKTAALAGNLFSRLDSNNDGRLDKGEFHSFLESLTRQIGTSRSAGIGTAGGTVAPTQMQASGPRIYQPMLGFDYVKLNTPSHTTAKYVFARATQDVPLPWDRASRSAGLSAIVENVRQNGYPNARVTDRDKIDFGDGWGNIDVLTHDGQWWWGPKGA